MFVQRVSSYRIIIITVITTHHRHQELKSTQPTLAGAVADVIHSSGWLDHLPSNPMHAPWTTTLPNIIITSMHLSQLTRSLQRLPTLRHHWLVTDTELTEDVVQTALQHGMHGVCPGARDVTCDGVDLAKAAGLDVRGFGVKGREVREVVCVFLCQCCGGGGCGVPITWVSWFVYIKSKHYVTRAPHTQDHHASYTYHTGFAAYGRGRCRGLYSELACQGT